MFNVNPYYRNYSYNNYYRYNNFIPTYYPKKDYTVENEEDIDIPEDSTLAKYENNTINEEKKEEENSNIDSSSKKQFRLGPLSVNDDSINILGFSIAIDDLIIIGLIILLLFQSDTDYIIIIILGLLLLNIDFSSLNLF